MSKYSALKIESTDPIFLCDLIDFLNTYPTKDEESYLITVVDDDEIKPVCNLE